MATALRPFGYAIYLIIILEVIGAAMVILFALRKKKNEKSMEIGGGSE